MSRMKDLYTEVQEIVEEMGVSHALAAVQLACEDQLQSDLLPHDLKYWQAQHKLVTWTFERACKIERARKLPALQSLYCLICYAARPHRRNADKTAYVCNACGNLIPIAQSVT